MAVSHVFSNIIADATGTLTIWNGATTATVAASDLVKPSNWNSVHANNVTLTGNTLGNSSLTGTNIVYGGSNNVTLSGNQGANAATINIIARGGILSDFDLRPNIFLRAFGTQTESPNILHIQPFRLEADLSASVIYMPCTFTNSTSAASSGRKGITIHVGIYSQDPGNQSRLTLHSSTSWSMSASYSSNVSMAYGAITGLVNSTSYATTSSSSAGVNVSSHIHGDRAVIIPINSLSAGNWWIATFMTSTGAGTPGNILGINRLCGTTQGGYPIPGTAVTATNAVAINNMIGIGTKVGVDVSTMPSAITLSTLGNAGFSVFDYFAVGASRR